MQNIQQLFHKNYRFWTEKQRQQIQQFFICNRFFSKFYQNKKFSQVSRICLYRQIRCGQKLHLENNNRAEAIILLTGNVIVRKKERRIRKKPKMHDEETLMKKERVENSIPEEQFEYTFLHHLKEFNETLTLNSECIVQAPQDKKAEIIFVPCALYYKLQQDIENERVAKIQHVLQRFFSMLKKKEIHQLSQSNCIFREFKMNNYIYRASSKPEEVYILLEGMVKLEKPGFSQQTLKENILVNAGTLFGQRDIKLQERNRNAIACTAHVQVLTIPKNSFLKYAVKAFPYMVFEQKPLSPRKLQKKAEQNLKVSRSVKIPSDRKNSLFPEIRRNSHFHQTSLQMDRKRSQSQQKRQYELIRNSHMLVDMKQRQKKKFQLRSYSPKSKEQIQSLIKKQKTKLRELKLSSRFSLDNSLLSL